ncbi:MAG: bifunctional adenosylcobinamide kinase/adenosylcobinamide-phosphate guanylyltransferase [Clostridium sp.]|uniref:bifunctional adenosylcobinamide kinase/adenosylcobinamide-phosphate guanylyltransferase n=1 Tax=Clostridium sp. TaxID=1506 RepID=UPI0025C0CD31|nr:bifunctional adenosylcobinamide kinase/adenosylcobinamide-phosphate guanylyltransferase [Clostridium sp.]MCF0149293.1 bifunctional adenosylcobinamide kinase/adenosylcobinamide-phosphate guanylyltransferase [Clostridium sp.]
MILIFGGAYNGKLNFAKEKFNIHDDRIYTINDELNNLDIDLSKDIINEFHKFIYKLSLKGIDATEYMVNNKELFKDKIIICDDISQGIVPLKKEDRLWRENTGKCLQYISKNSKMVYRVFCGIATVIKNEED